MAATAVFSLRKYVSWIFALAFVIGVPITLSTTWKILGSIRQREPHLHVSASYWVLVVLVPWVLPLQTAVFGMAWWSVFREKRSARVWGILASLSFLAWVILPLLLTPHFFWSGDLLILAIGIVGMIAFAWPAQPSPIAATVQQSPSLPGDGTSAVLNKAWQFASLLAYWGTYSWWLAWLRAHDLPRPDFISGTLRLVGLSLVIVILHESGHALSGVLLGMKVRAFLAGPFQWRIRDGKWTFAFEPRQIFVTMGATGIVPATRDFTDFALLATAMAGVLVNAVTGAVALWLANIRAGEAASLFTLFGAFSLAVAIMNLVPFRFRDYYSDGAQIYQILSGGAWTDFRRVVALAGAATVSPLRPRDYDIEAIHRACHTIREARQGLLLRLLAFSYFLDHGNLVAAGEEVVHAVSIYNTSASDAPAEFVSCFVFSSAYISRSAEVTRQWWAHFEAKNPAQNLDFWLAHSALSWIEGDLSVAQDSLNKAQTLGQSLPQAGAYEFERHCCSLLRDVLDEARVAAVTT